MHDLIQELTIEEDGNRIAIRKYATNTSLVNDFKDFDRNIAPLAAEMEYKGGRTDAALGLRQVLNHDFQIAQGSREDAAKILITITDGNSDDRFRTYKEARRISKDTGLYINYIYPTKISGRKLENLTVPYIKRKLWQTQNVFS